MAAVPGFDDHEIHFWMDKYGYTAEPFQATSETGYISTIFQIKGDHPVPDIALANSESKGSVVFMHGTYSDAVGWFDSLPAHVLA